MNRPRMFNHTTVSSVSIQAITNPQQQQQWVPLHAVIPNMNYSPRYIFQYPHTNGQGYPNNFRPIGLGQPIYSQYVYQSHSQYQQFNQVPAGAVRVHQPIQETNAQYSPSQYYPQPNREAYVLLPPPPQIRPNSDTTKQVSNNSENYIFRPRDPRIREEPTMQQAVPPPKQAVPPMHAIPPIQALPPTRAVPFHPAYRRQTQTQFHLVQMTRANSSTTSMSTQSQSNERTKPIRRIHAVDIINPITHANVLDELTNTSNTANNYDIRSQRVPYINSAYYSHVAPPPYMLPNDCITITEPPNAPISPASDELSINVPIDFVETSPDHPILPALNVLQTSPNLETIKEQGDFELNIDENLDEKFGRDIGLWRDQSTPIDTVDEAELSGTEIEYTDAEENSLIIPLSMDIQSTEQEQYFNVDEVSIQNEEIISPSISPIKNLIDADIMSSSSLFVVDSESSILGSNVTNCEKESSEQSSVSHHNFDSNQNIYVSKHDDDINNISDTSMQDEENGNNHQDQDNDVIDVSYNNDTGKIVEKMMENLFGETDPEIDNQLINNESVPDVLVCSIANKLSSTSNTDIESISDSSLNASKLIESLLSNTEVNDSTNDISNELSDKDSSLNASKLIESLPSNTEGNDFANKISNDSKVIVEESPTKISSQVPSPIQIPPFIRMYSKAELIELRNSPHCEVKPALYSRITFLHIQSDDVVSSNLMPSFARNYNINHRNKRMHSTAAILRPAHGKNYNANRTSMHKNANHQDRKPDIFINLVRNEDVKLNKAENAWRPNMMKDNVPTNIGENEGVFRKVRGILNKLTSNNFDALVEQILNLKLNTRDKVNGVMVLVFEKAIDEQNFSESYARLCLKLSDIHFNNEDNAAANQANNKFKHALLDKTELEFNQNVFECKAKQIKLTPIIEEIQNCTDANKKTVLEALLVEQERKIRQRSVGTVRFVGELYKMNMLTDNIIGRSTKMLLDPKSEDKLECLCKLLTTVGKKYQTISKNMSQDSSQCHVNDFIKEMKTIISKKNNLNLSSRIRFMIQDVIDFHDRNWESKSSDKPKKNPDVQTDREEERNNDFLNIPVNNSSSNERRLHYDDRNTGNRYNSSIKNINDNEISNEHWNTVVNKNNKKHIDTNKLRSTSTNYDDSKLVLGASSQFQWDKKRKNFNVASVESNSSLQDTNIPSDSNRLSQSSVSYFNNSSNTRLAPIHDSKEKSINGKDNNRTNYTKDCYRDNTNSKSNKQPIKEKSPIKQLSKLAKSVSSVRSVPIHDSKQKSINQKDNNRTNCTKDRYRDDTNSKSNKQPNTEKSPKKQSSKLAKSVSTSTANSKPGPSQLPPRPSQLPPPPQLPPPQLPPPPRFAELDYTSEETLKGIVIEMFPLNSTPEECKVIIEKYPLNQRWAIIYLLLTEYIHLRNIRQIHREHAAELVIILNKSNLLTNIDIQHGYKKFNEVAEDILLDVPTIWKHVTEFSGPLLYHGSITLKTMCIEKFRGNNGEKFIEHVILVLCKEFGPNFVRNVWKKSDLKWQAFIVKNQIKNFIAKKQFGFIKSKEIISPPTAQLEPDMLRLNSRIKALLKTDMTKDTIIDYISGNVLDNSNKDFIQGLTTTILKNAIFYEKSEYILNITEMRKVGIDLLKYYIGSKLDREVECLYAVQQFVSELEFPTGLFREICLELHNSDILHNQAFMDWKLSKKYPIGKRVAVSSIGSFLEEMA